MSNFSSNYQPRPNYPSNQSSSLNSSPILVNSGLTDRDGARQVARRIIDTYDRDKNGVIDSI